MVPVLARRDPVSRVFRIVEGETVDVRAAAKTQRKARLAGIARREPDQGPWG
jgi:hypothetical protein